MLSDAPESVAKHSYKLQPSIQLHVLITISCSAALVHLVLNVVPQKNEGSAKSRAVDRASYHIGTHLGLEPRTSETTVRSGNH